jgi:hypothetical protein
METEARDALQRAGLKTLVSTFHLTVTHSTFWSGLRRQAPPEFAGSNGVWTGSVSDSYTTLLLRFTDTHVGEFALNDDGRGNMAFWQWTSGLHMGDHYFRGSPNLPAERDMVSPSGALPNSLFELAWQNLHDAFREYIWHYDLKPAGLARTLFPRP